MVRNGYTINHSTHFNLSWAFQFQREVLAGNPYPRWLDISNFGFGNATFVFYPPMCMFAPLPFHWLGFDVASSLVGSMWMALLTFSFGLYRCCRCYFPTLLAVAIAAVGMMAPYLLTNIYIRGAIGEVWAMAAIPWILYASQAVADANDKRIAMIKLALAYSLLIVSHLLTLMLFTLFWLGYPWVVARTGDRKRTAISSYLAVGLATGLSAVYLFPAALDQSLVQIESVNFSDEYMPQHRLIVSGLSNFAPILATHWFDKTLIGIWGLGLVVVILAARAKPQQSGAEAIPWLLKLYWIACAGLSLLIMTDILAWVYTFPSSPLRRIQFSWRWMSVMTPFLSLLCGYYANELWRNRRDYKHGAISPASIGAIALVFLWQFNQGLQVLAAAQFNPDTINRFVSLSEQTPFPYQPPMAEGKPFLNWHWSYPNGLAIVDVPEYRAKGVELWMPPSKEYPLVAWENGDQQGLEVQQWQYGNRQFSAHNDSEEEATVELKTFWYPGWQIKLDGVKAEAKKSAEGLLQAAIPPGTHSVQAYYAGTMMEQLGGKVSLLSFAVLAMFAVWANFKGLRRSKHR